MLYALENSQPTVAEDSWIAPNASLIGQVHVHRQASIWFNCVLRGDTDLIEVGAGSNVQDGSVLHTDAGIKLRIGQGCTIGHKVMLHGCEIGDHTLIGIGAVVLNRARIGSHCLVGAGALVTEGKVFPDGVMLMGSPARVVRELSAAEQKMLEMMAQHYVANAQRYQAQLRALA
ncbi:gamma carbonic anhydrase family protein [Sinimarinibacterium sp. NLF-5-8]|uniref:gamma carbonic anhydrase family protein n=1 Tax=Sinimarinibacterium sp. NLF-5-8 TaxID=2698684 RepID=UPI00137C305E|nr:gamma carbonic anhydrase family protein [Sinimarinibacterium sp. NLF-5-8]QHS09564.1 gamma carbonic anhydrase family protein [Sinimarinibacterium sp. NLF-5-8]